MANDAEILIQEAIFRGYLNDSNNYSFKQSGEVLKAMWVVGVNYFDFENNFASVNDFVKENSNEAHIYIECFNLKRRVLVKGKILFEEENIFEEENSTVSTQKQFENLFEEGESSFAFVVKNIKEKKPDVSCELKLHVSRENAFYLICKQAIRPVQSDTDRVLQLFNKRFDKDLLTLYHEGQFSDVTLRCESKIFKVHKCVLSARSKVFAAMFHNPMKESESDVVEIKDISSDTLDDLLIYIYLNKAPKLIDITSPYDILAAADMYDLPELKALCILKLRSRLSVDNAIFTLSFADLYSRGLKKKCINYICKEYYHLKNTQEWVTLKKEKPILANEVLENLTKLINHYCDKVGVQKRVVFCPMLKFYN